MTSYSELAGRRQRYAALRKQWFAKNGPCTTCGSWEDLQVDHINPNTKVSWGYWRWTKERREEELSKCQALCRTCHLAKTAEEKAKNKRLYANNTSGCPGVFWNKLNRRWRARVSEGGRAIYLGSFVSLDEAIASRRLAEPDYGYHQNHGRAKT